jgi:hypothetical protein
LNPERHQVAIENLPDLIEDNVARYGIAPRKVWGWALEAIEKDVLRPVFPAGQSLDTKFSHGGMGPLTLRNIISARRKIDHYDPATENWAKNLSFDTDAFKSWLKKALSAHRIVGRKKTKRERISAFIAESYPDDIPADKTVVLDIKAKLGDSVSERTVRRARGRA